MFAFQSVSLSKKLFLVGIVLVPIAVFLFFFLKKGAPSSPDQGVAGNVLPSPSAQTSFSGQPDPQETRLMSESSDLDSLRSGAPAGSIEQQSSSLDALWKKAGKSTVSADAQSRELDAKALNSNKR